MSPCAALQPALRQARVLQVSGRETILDLDPPTPAQLAFSCPVQPQPGDLVLCLDAGPDGHHLLAILERPGSQAMTLAFPGEAQLQTAGSLSLLAGQGITLTAGGQLACASDAAVLRSRETVLDCCELVAQGRVLQASFDSITFLGRMFQTLVQHLIQKSRGYFRHTQETDQVRAGQMLRQAEGLCSLESQYTVLTSARDTRIDGERIHMG